ncbi:MAG: TlpA family protein disulfide reductase [Planctomycetales bacterium]
MRGPTPSRRGEQSVSLMFWPLLALLAALLLYYSSRSSVPLGAGSRHLAVGKQVNSLAFWTLEDEPREVRLEDVKERVVLVNLWGTWCPPCVQEAPHLAHLADQFRDDDFRMFAVSCESVPDDLDSVRASTEIFLEDENIQLPVYGDPSGAARQILFDALGKGAYPATILLDEERTIRAAWIGYVPGTEKDMENTIRVLLKE